MAGYIGSKSSVTQVDGYTEAEADAEFVTKTGDTMSGNLDVTGDVDTSGLFRFGVNNSEIANNYLRFKSGGAAYFDHSTVGQPFNFRVSNSSSLDTNAMTISSSGNVGIGVSPTFSAGGSRRLLQLTNGASGGQIAMGNNANESENPRIFSDADNLGFATATTGGGVFQFYTGGSERMRIDSSGQVGIGTSSPSSNLHIKTSVDNSLTQGLIIERSANSDKGYINYQAGAFQIRATDGDPIAFGQVSNERMRIDSSGTVLVGKTTSAFSDAGTALYQNGELNLVHANNAPLYLRRLSGTGTIAQFWQASSAVGSISVTASSTAYNTSSDYRLKENVVDLTGASARVNQLNPSRFNFIADDTNTLVDGFLAHEVADVVPEAITGTKDAMKDEEYEVTPAVEATYDEDGNELTAAVEAVMGTRSVPDYQGIDQSKLVPLLTAALQEALTEIASLKTRVEALEA